jgi:3'(2'), 5'-bisphosphate nucleotidase
LDRAAPRLEAGLLEAVTELVARAAAAILAVGRADLATRTKADRSPVTAADEAAEAVVLAGLAQLLPGVPVISEEKADGLPSSAHSLRPAFLLVDPLDGTRELLAGRDEYTVNVALVVDGVPVLGAVAAPARALIWRGMPGRGAERLRIAPPGEIVGAAMPIRARPWPARDPVAAVSRSHLDRETVALLARLPGIRQYACGSALKFCRLAEGAADLYPRLAPTSEWDVAAGHAVLAAAGGVVVTPAGAPLMHGRAEDAFRIPAFVALADPAAASMALAASPPDKQET